MSREIRSRRLVPAGSRPRPLYVRVLGLQYINPSGMLCFVFFESTVALAVLLALAEQVSWWAVLVLPAAVAVMVKINDVVAGALMRSGGAAPRVVGRATVRAGRATVQAPGPERDLEQVAAHDESEDPAALRALRQSAARRYS